MTESQRTFAEVKWSIGDVQTLKPNWDEARCHEFLADNGKYIQEIMVMAGWDAMETLLWETGDLRR